MESAPTEPFLVHLGDHRQRAAIPLRLPLRERPQVRDLGRGEERGRGVRAGRDAGAAPDAGGVVHREIGVGLRDREGVRVLRRPRRRGDVAARLDDPVEGPTVHHEVLDHREGLRPPRLDPDVIPILEAPHMKLAGGGELHRPVGRAVDHQAAGATDPLATIVIEGDRLLPLRDQPLVHDIEHLEEAHVRTDVRGGIVDDVAGSVRAGLSPDVQREGHPLAGGVQARAHL